MLIPQFSLRALLGVTGICALVCLVVSLGFQGHIWAIAISIALMTTVLVTALYGMLFLVVWMFSVAMEKVGRGVAGPAAEIAQSPFAREVPVPKST